jgi:hypothetical protein
VREKQKRVSATAGRLSLPIPELHPTDEDLSVGTPAWANKLLSLREAKGRRGDRCQRLAIGAGALIAMGLQ